MVWDTKVGGKEYLTEAAELIRRGEVVAFPTETVYGLGANALDERAVEKIYIAKNRPKDNPFIVHVTDLDNAEKAAFVTDEAARLFAKFSPGPLTVVLKKKECVPYIVTAGLETVGIRIPSHPLCREFLALCDRPVAAPSANVSKRVSPTEAEYVYEDMKGRIPLILDGGRCDVGIESTVISLAGEVPTILRPGIITAEELAEVLGRVKTHTGEVKVAQAPGMKYRHYAPTVPCMLYRNPVDAMNYYDEEVKNGKHPVIFARSANKTLFGDRNTVDMGCDGKEIAHNIFHLLRYYEKKNEAILIEALSETGEEGAVMNRIEKSCDGKYLS